MKTKTKSFITKMAILVVCVFMFTAGFLTLGLNNNSQTTFAATGSQITTGNFATTEGKWNDKKTTNLITTPTLPSYNTGDGKDLSKWKSFWDNKMVPSGWGSDKISGDDNELQVYATTALDGSDTFAIRPAKSGTYWGGDACLGGAGADTVEERYEGGVSYTIQLSVADQAIANSGYLKTSAKAEIYMQKLIVCYASIKVEFYKADGSLIIQERNVWHSGVFENRYTSRSVSGITVPQETVYIRYWFSNNSVGNVRKAVKNMQAYLQDNTPVATKTHDGITFTAWDKNDSLPTSGNYFLTKDVSLTSAWAPTGDVNLCLSGYKIIQTADSETVNVASGVNLNVYDCTEAGEITHASGKIGKGVIVYGALNLYAGKITGNGSASMNTRGGGVLILSGEFNMYGGEISNNSLGGARGAAVSVGNSTNNTASATFNMIGGEIYGNTVGEAVGSAVSVGGATTSGSHLFYFNMSGGKIYSNTTNGTGNTVGSADAVVVSKNGRITMTAGEITENRNGVYVEAGVITLSGTAYIDGNGSQQDIEKGGSCGNNLRLGVPKTDITDEDRYLTIGAGGLTQGASIGVSGVSVHGAQISSGAVYKNNTDYATADSLKYIYSDDSNKKLIYAQYNGTDYAIMTETGHNHSDLYFEEWEILNGSVNSGYYYLESDVIANGEITITGQVTLCLNGYALNMVSDKMIIATGAKFQTCDCQQSPYESGGEITGSGDTVIENNGDFSMDGGTVNNTNAGSGDALKNNSSGKFNMNNGNLSSKSGSAFKNDGGTVEAAEGASFTTGASEEIPPHTHEGVGELTAWTATSGTLAEGNYYLTDSNLTALTDDITIAKDTTVTLCLNGNELLFDEAHGLTVNGTLNICDCQSTHGTIAGNIGISNKGIITNEGTLNIQAGNIINTNDYSDCSTIFNKGTLSITGGTISGEKSVVRNFSKTSVATVSGENTSIISNSLHAIYNHGGIVTVNGGKITSNTGKALYNASYLDEYGVTNIYGGTFTSYEYNYNGIDCTIVLGGNTKIINTSATHEAIYTSGNLYIYGTPEISVASGAVDIDTGSKSVIFAHNKVESGTPEPYAGDTLLINFYSSITVAVKNVTEDNKDKFTADNSGYVLLLGTGDNANDLFLHKHAYTVKYDATNHWKECSCGEKQDVSAHNTSGVCTCGVLLINETNFPDATFMAYVQTLTGGDDNFFTAEELSNITSINIYDYRSSILSLEGIKYFTALDTLYCYSGELTSLDVSGLTSLKTLYCHSNKLTSLTVSGCTALEEFRCNNNQLVSLNVRGLTSLKIFSCSKNLITSLDVSDCTLLKTLYCDNNKLTSLDVSNNTALTLLDCQSNDIVSLDVSENTLLEKLYCNSNELTSLKLDNTSALTYLNCSTNKLISLDLTASTALKTLYCSSNELTTLDITALEELAILSCTGSKLTSLDLSKNTKLTELYCYSNKLTNLDLSKNTELQTIYCFSNELTSLDLSGLTSLKTLICYRNKFTSLDLSAYESFNSYDGGYHDVDITIDQKTMTFDMSTLDENFVVANATVKTAGCSFNGKVLTVKEGINKVEYSYATGSGTRTITVYLHITNPHTHAIVNGDSDCTTEVKCFCGKVIVAKNASHTYAYTASGNVITETCSVEGCTVHTATATIVKPEGTLTYNGNEFNATVDYSTEWAGGTLMISYTRDGDTVSAGEITASITVGGKTASVTYTITKANHTAPTGVGKVDTSYIDTTDGKITGVTNVMEYKLSTASDYIPISGTEITNLPSGTYYVRFAETDNYNASNNVSVTINKGGKRTATITNISDIGRTYNGTAVSNPTYTYTNGANGEITITWYADNSGVRGNALVSAPMNAGTYWVGVKASEGDIYNAVSEVAKQFTIGKATYDMSGITFDNGVFTYSGNANSIYISGDLPTGVSVDYLNNGVTNATTEPITVTATFTGDSINYNAIPNKTATIIINPKNINGANITLGSALTYTGEEQIQTVASVVIDGLTVTYDISGNKQTNVGASDYTLTVTGKGNFTGTANIAWNIAKAQAEISVDTTPIVKTYGDTWTLPIATSNFGSPLANLTVLQMKDADTYTLTFTVEATSNYLGDTESISVTINKAKVNKPAEDTTVFIYMGSEQTYTVAENTLYTISGTIRTDAGSQDVTISLKDKDNYEWADESTADVIYSFVINKANAVITVDTTPIVKTYGDVWTLPVATTNFGTLVCDKVIGDLVNANTYTVTYTVAGTSNYNGDVKKVSVTINKATYDMTAITFADSVVKYNGETHSLAISGALPNGVTVEYDGNDKALAGVYTITANFIYDTVNFNVIEPMTATLTINQDKVVDSLGEGAEQPSVEITTESGLAPNVEIVITEIDSTGVAGSELVGAFDKVSAVYGVTMKSNGVEVQPNGNITVKLLIPEELNGKQFRILTSVNGEYTEIEYAVDGDYAVFTVDELVEFSFVNYQFPWWIVVLAIVIVVGGVVAGIVIYKKKKTA